MNPVGTHTGPWTFSQALECLKAGGRVRRKGWVLADIVIRDGRIEFASIPGTMAYHLGHGDILADDWESVST